MLEIGFILFYSIAIFVLMVFLIIKFRKNPGVLGYFFISRIPILAAIILVGLPVLAIRGPGKEMLQSLFALSGWQLFITTLVICFTVFWIRCLWRIILIYVPEKYSLDDLRTKPVFRWWSRWFGWAWMLLAVPGLVALFINSEDTTGLTVVWMSLGILFNLLLLIPLILFLTPTPRVGRLVDERLIRWFADEGSLSEWYLLTWLGFKPAPNQEHKGNVHGATGPETWWGRIIRPLWERITRPGHGAMFFFGTLTFLYYALAGLLLRSTPILPALFTVLALLNLAAWLLANGTRMADRYHIPVLIALILFTIFNYSIWDVDHYFSTTTRTDSNWISLEDAFDKRIENKETVILVTAAGGGIQAAAWTAEVLFGLEKLYPKTFTSSLALVSSVSGGSIGSMYYLDTFNGTEQEREKSQTAASENSLDAVAWGYLYPDTLRFMGLPFFVKKHIDRGWAIEQAWQKFMKEQPGQQKEVTFGAWAEKIKKEKGGLPIPIFNCTFVETGQRLLFTPVKVPVMDARKSFFDSYPGRDIKVVTAARLSATFPYITPVARAQEWESPEQKDAGKKKSKDFELHIADGGYYDNYGVMTVVDLLHSPLLKNLKEKNVRNVIILQITLSKAKESNAEGGWVSAMFGPLKTLLNMRGSTQLDRKELEINLLKESHGGKLPAIKVTEARFEAEPVLSWKLTSKQIKDIEDEWQEIVQERREPIKTFIDCGFVEVVN